MYVALKGVHPAVALRAERIVASFRAAGWPLSITSGYRSSDQQASLRAAGLTAARASRHVSGTAFDLSFDGYTRAEALALPRWVWNYVGRAGEQLGLRWGGRFSDYDPFHFDAG